MLFVIYFRSYVHLVVLATTSNCSVHGYGSLNIWIVSFVVCEKSTEGEYIENTALIECCICSCAFLY